MFKRNFITYGVISHDYSNRKPDFLVKDFKDIKSAINYCEKLDRITLFDIEHDFIKNNKYTLHYVKPLTHGFLIHLIKNIDKF